MGDNTPTRQAFRFANHFIENGMRFEVHFSAMEVFLRRLGTVALSSFPS